MKRVRGWVVRLVGLVTGRRRRDAEITAEIEEHVQMLTEENSRAGLPPEEARRAAFLTFGGVEVAKERYRDQRSVPQIETLLQDLRFALRSCVSRPASTLVIVLSLAIGIGLNTTLFTWLKAVYFDSLPGVPKSRQLLTISAAYKFGNGYSDSYQDFVYIRDHSRLFAGLFAHEMELLALSAGNSAEITGGGIVSGNYFDVLKVPIAVGRGLTAQDDAATTPPIVVISDAVWRRRFDADPGIAGKTIALNKVPFTVIGVAAPRFVGVYGGIRQDFWIPLSAANPLDPNHTDPLTHGMALQIMGRAKPGVSREAVQAELTVLTRQMQPVNHKDSPDYKAEVYPLHESARGFHSGIFDLVQILGIAVFILLLLACFNAANLLLGRATERAREMGVRISLGAGRARIIRQLLTESFAMAAASGLAGLLLVYATRSLPYALVPPGIELYFNADFDWTVLAFLLAITLLTTAIFGLLPALETGKVDIIEALKEGAGSVTAGTRRRLWRRFLVICQVTLATAALFCGVLFMAHVRRITSADRGFESKNILTVDVDLAAAGFSEPRGRTFQQDSVRLLESRPGVQSAAWTTFLPMSGFGGSNVRATIVPGYAPPNGKPMSVVVDTASAGYLKAMGIPLARGREFEGADSQTSRLVAIVNQKFVDEYLRGRDPIGAAVIVDTKPRTIVGVHRDYLYRDPTQPPRSTILLPLTQDYNADATLVVRTAAEPTAFAPVLRQLIASVDRNIALTRVMTMEQNIQFHFASLTVGTGALLFFAAVALMLAAVGLYTVLAAFVAQRRREFGIRMALGATPRDVRARVLAESTLLTSVGGCVGLALSVGIGSLLRSEVFEINPFDFRLYLAAACGIGLIATFSTLAPALAASRMQPMAALRTE